MVRSSTSRSRPRSRSRSTGRRRCSCWARRTWTRPCSKDDVDNRQAPHRPRPGGGARGREAGRWPLRNPAGGPRPLRRHAPGARAGGMAPRLLEFADELRSEGVAVGTSELLDAFNALDAVSWTSARTSARRWPRRSPSRRRTGTCSTCCSTASSSGPWSARRSSRASARSFQGGEELDLEAARAHPRGMGPAPTARCAIARLAIAAFGRQGEGSGVIGVDVQRIRRTLGLKGEKRRGAARPGRRAAQPPGVRAPRAPRAGAPDDRADQSLPPAKPRGARPTAVGSGSGPVAGAPHGGPAEEAPRVARARAPRPSALLARGRAPHDAPRSRPAASRST